MIQTVSSGTAGETPSPLPGVAIIVCVHNAPEDVRQCLDALLRHTDLNRHHLILVDDGSEPETRRLLIPYITTTGATYIRNDNPRGYTIAANQGIRAASHPFVLLLNSDTITPAGWLERLIACALSGPRIACVGPLSNAASWQSIPQLTDASGQWRVNQLPQETSLEEYAHRIASHSARIYPSTPFINGFCLLINRAAMASVGLLDEETFPRGYGEEDDFCLRAIDAGFENRVADDCYVFHAKSKSFTSDGRAATVALAKGKLTDKHGKRRIRNHVQSMQANEQLLIARTWARLAAEHPFAPPLPVKERNAAPHPLHIGWLQPHLQSVGGIRRTIEMTNRLVSRGHQVHLITPDGRKTDWLPIFAQVTPAEEARRIDFDLLLLSDPDMVPIHRQMKKRWTVNYHLAAYMLYREANADLKRYYAGDDATTHIANSAWTAQQADKHHGIRMQGIFPGGIDKRLFRPHAVEKTFDLACYGSDRPHKGTADIRQAAGRRSLLQLAHLGLDQQDLARHICSAKVFVSGCWHEGFNFCPLEAMSCGVPVVMTDCGGSREYALDGINALVVPPRDTQALENAIQRLLEDTELRLRLIENGLETAWRYDWDSITQRLCELIEHLAL
jgi:GT2 family glycosyltransferase